MERVAVEVPNVVIVGAGFGGLEAARTIGSAGIPVTLIDKRNHHLFQPLLYQVATAGLSPADIAEPIRKALRNYPTVEVRLGEVTGVDLATRRVLVAEQASVPYERLIIATGAGLGYFGHDDWGQHAPGLKSIEDARRIRARLLLGFELAELEENPSSRLRQMTTVIVGGGPTGVELAGAVAELTRHALRRDFRRIRPETAKIILIEAGPRVLAGFSAETSDYATTVLERLGVEVVVGAPVSRLADGVVKAGDQEYAAGTIIWAAGVAASPAGKWLGVQTDRQGRVPVDSDFSVPDVDGVYAIGDVARAEDAKGEPLPGLAQVAKQQGSHLGKIIVAELRGQPAVPPFRYRDRGNAAIVGRNAAVFEFASGRRMRGRFAWVVWAIVHVWLLIGFEHRLLVSLQWLWRYATYERGARLITDEPAAGGQRRRTVEGA